MTKRRNLMADGLYQRFRGHAGAHKQIAPLLRVLKVGKVHDQWSRVSKVGNPCIARDADDLDILIFRHEAESNAFSDGISIGKQSFREAAAHDSDARVLLIRGLIKFTAAKQRNPERLQEAR